MTDGILLVLMSSHFDCSDPSILPRGPYVLCSSLKECRKGAWRHASSEQLSFQYNAKHAKHSFCHYSRQLTQCFFAASSEVSSVRFRIRFCQEQKINHAILYYIQTKLTVSFSHLVARRDGLLTGHWFPINKQQFGSCTKSH